ncbi:MAG: penicillin-binding protein 2 [Actinomycetota bacterium]|nr:penicillin-binding protein 2 [Actinomycetota bacterium]
MTSRERPATAGLDRTTLRLAVFGILIVAAFVALFSRLWFLQVLAAEEYEELAKENRVRLVHSEPTRGRIVDRNGVVLVANSSADAVTVDRHVVDTVRKKRIILRRLSELLDIPKWKLRQRLGDITVSPYKPIPVAYNIPRRARFQVIENQEDFFGAVNIQPIPKRVYPSGNSAAHLLGYVREISQDQLDSDHFKGARPPYRPGDLVGHDGLEYTYDRWLRGTPEIRKVIVNSSDEVLSEAKVREEQVGDDLVLHVDARIQKLTEDALEAGIMASRGSYETPAGAAVVMDPNTGGVLGMASFPTFGPRVFTDGVLTNKEYKRLGAKTRHDPDDDALINRAIQAQRAPASTFKIVTAGAAMATDIASAYTTLPCPPAAPYPPPGRTSVGSAEIFNNWTSLNLGTMGFPESLEVSCDTFYYELGWQMEDAFGASIFGDENTERFQKYARLAGIGHETGIDLPNELDGLLPDWRWCRESWQSTKKDRIPTCGTKDGPVWLPGYTINMAIGQGDLLTTPIQMAVTTAAIANGGAVMQPRLASQIARPNEEDVEQPVKVFEPKEEARLPLDALELSMIQQGMVEVVSGSAGTAASAFSGFPLEAVPVAGKTGTSELGETDLQDAWFVSYAPADDPQYVIVVYLEKSGHGGESAAPIAREIYEGLFGVDQGISVQLGVDESG